MASIHTRITRLLLGATLVAVGACRGADSQEGAEDDPYQLDPLGLAPEGEEDPLKSVLIPPPDEPIVADRLDLTAKGTAAVPLEPGGDTPPVVAGEEPLPVSSRTVDVRVERGESMKLYSDWSGVPENDLLPDGGLTRNVLKAGRRIELVMTHDQFQRFSDNREKYRLAREREFLERHEIEKLVEHKVVSGDNLWKIAQVGGSDVPVWLLKRLNRNIDLEHLRIGDVVLVPKLRQMADRGARVGEELWKPATEVDVERITQTSNGGSIKKTVGQDAQPVAVDALKIRVKANETVGLLSKWSGIPRQQILRDNPTIKGGLTYDQTVVLKIPDGKTASFMKERNAFHATNDLFDVDRPAGGTAAVRAAEQRPILRPTVRLKQVTVQKRDTLGKIAKRHGVTVQAIRANNPRLGNRLRPGMVLQVPVERRR